MKLSKIVSLNRLEKQEAITKMQAIILQERLDVLRKQKLIRKHYTTKLGIRIAKILTKSRCKSLREIHNEVIKGIDLTHYQKEKDKVIESSKPEKKSFVKNLIHHK